jgi:hypothetical protein
MSGMYELCRQWECAYLLKGETVLEYWTPIDGYFFRPGRDTIKNKERRYIPGFLQSCLVPAEELFNR